MLAGEYRYLQEDYEGRLDFEYLPTDQLDNGNHRTLFSIDHYHWFG